MCIFKILAKLVDQSRVRQNPPCLFFRTFFFFCCSSFFPGLILLWSSFSSDCLSFLFSSATLICSQGAPVFFCGGLRRLRHPSLFVWSRLEAAVAWRRMKTRIQDGFFSYCLDSCMKKFQWPRLQVKILISQTSPRLLKSPQNTCLPSAWKNTDKPGNVPGESPPGVGGGRSRKTGGGGQ